MKSLVGVPSLAVVSGCGGDDGVAGEYGSGQRCAERIRVAIER